MSYRDGSHWDEKYEMSCLVVLKKLQAENFPWGKQMDYCREISKETKLSPGSLSAKVSNYKSVSRINGASNASVNTVKVYKKYKDYSIQRLESIINQ